MKITTWIIHILVFILFILAGATKLFTPYQTLVLDENMKWVTDFSPMIVKIIGGLELLGALGLILPLLLKKWKGLIPTSALALGGTMIGAALTHFMRGEPIIINIVILIMTLTLAWFKKDMLKRP